MTVARSRVRVASRCDVLVVVALCGTAPAEPLANAQFIVVPTMELSHHLV
jgi:hypothetical protein